VLSTGLTCPASSVIDSLRRGQPFRRSRDILRAYWDSHLMRHPPSPATAAWWSGWRRARRSRTSRRRPAPSRNKPSWRWRIGRPRSAAAGSSGAPHFVVTEAGSEGALLYADVDLALARQQDFVYAQDASRRIGSLTGPLDRDGPLVDPKLWPQTPRRAREAALIAPC
jgi:hypothetical protein